jgi:cation transport ATPase
MLFYGIAALMEFLMNPDVLGPSVIAFKVYYILSAPLVGLLGAGVMYLLASKRKADIFLAFIAILSAALLVTGIMTPLDEAVIVEAFEGSLGEAFHIAVDAYPMTVRRYAIITNIVAGLALILGALYSFLKDRRRTYNLLIFVGGVMPMIGGSALAFFDEPSLFFIFELVGTIFLYLGFIYSDRFIKAREAKISSTLAEKLG